MQKAVLPVAGAMIASGVIGALFTTAQPARGFAPAKTTTSISFSPSAIVAGGTTVTVTASVDPSAAAGTLIIHRCYGDPDDIGPLPPAPQPASFCTAGGGNQIPGKSEVVASGAAVGGQFSTNVTETNPGPGDLLIGFWAEFNSSSPSTYSHSESPVLDVTWTATPYVGGGCEGGHTTGVEISAIQGQGDGTPPPGPGHWSFIIQLQACEDLANVTAQGGANGWSAITDVTPSAGVAEIRKENKKNTIYRWLLGAMSEGQIETLEIEIDGTIKPSSCGGSLNLNGGWSSTYTDLAGASNQTSHTGKVLIAPVCN